MDWKSAYVISSTIGQMFCWFMAVITPVYFTPDKYIWTGVFIIVSILGSISFYERINKWEK